MNDPRVEALLDRWEAAWEEGQEVQVDELCDNCPELKPELESLITQLKRTQWMMSDCQEVAVIAGQVTRCDSLGDLVDHMTVAELTDAIVATGLCAMDEISDEYETAADLIDNLIESRRITPYQAQEIARGNGRKLVLGNYVILEKIGRGGMGEVFKALHRKMDRIVALKMLPQHALDSPAAVRRFEREVVAAGRLDHPNIVAAHDADDSDGRHFLVLQLIEGTDLSSYVQVNGPMNVSQAIDCIRQAATGLAYAHQEGIIHRDIKPSNLVLAEDGTLKVLDMGLARLTANDQGSRLEGLTMEGSVMGTADFMAPEQASSPESADARSDLYSLGCTLYFLLTGRAMFPESSVMAKLIAHRERPAPELNDESINQVFQQLVAKRPDDRFQSASELLETLTKLQLSDPTARIDSLTDANTPDETSLDLSLVDTEPTGAGATMIEPASTMAHAGGEQQSGDESVSPLATSVAGSWRRVAATGVLILGLGFIGWIVHGLFFRIELPDGVVLIRTSESVPAIQVNVQQNETIKLVDPNDGKTIEITVDADTKQLSLHKDGFRLLTKKFSLSDAEGREINVSFEPLSQPTSDQPVVATVEVPKAFALREPVRSMLQPGQPIIDTATVVAPAAIEGALSWTIESAQFRRSLWDCQFSPDDRFLAACGTDGRIRVYRNDDGSWKLHRVFLDGVSRHWLDWSPDSKFICVVGKGVAAPRVWEVESGVRYDLKSSDDSARGNVHDWIAWSPTGRHLAFHGKTEDATGIVILDLSTNTVQSVLPLQAYFEEGTWSPDGTQIATTSRDNQVRIWDIATGEVTTSISMQHPSSVGWSPDGSKIAFIAGNSQGVGVYLLEPGKKAPTLIPDAKGIHVRWASKDILMVGGWSDCTPWNVSTLESGETIVQQVDIFDTYELDCSSDGNWVAFAGSSGGLQVLDTETGQQVQLLSRVSRLENLHWSSEGDSLAIDGQVWDMTTPTPVRLSSPIAANETWSPPRRLIEANGWLGANSGDQALAYWNIESGEVLSKIQPDSGSVYAFSASPDKSKLAIITQNDAKVEIWDLGTRTHLKTFQTTLPDNASEPMWSSDGRFLAVSCYNDRDFVWDVASGAEIFGNTAKNQYGNGCVWSPHSNELLFPRHHGQVEVWDAKSRSLVRKNAFAGLGQCIWLPTGEIVSFDANYTKFLVINEQTEEIRLHVQGGSSALGEGYLAMAFSPDFARVAASDGRNIHFHNWPSAEPTMVMMDIGSRDFLPISRNGTPLREGWQAADIVFVVQEVDRQTTYTAQAFAEKFAFNRVAIDKEDDYQNDREVAEWVLSVGGFLDPAHYPEVKDRDDLPVGPFRIKMLNLYQVDEIPAAKLRQIAELTELEGLVISRAELPDQAIEIISGMKQLRWLYIGETSLKEQEVIELTDLPLLESLDINSSAIQSSTLQSLLKLKSLSVLNLYGTPITDDAIEWLAQMKTLTSLKIENTGITKEGVEELRNALHGCEIKY